MKWYDEIVKQSLVTQNPPEPELVKKLASIGIGPGKTPSGEANDTIKQVLQTGIQEGEKMISSQLASVREVINGWGVISTGLYGTDYLFRVAVAKHGLGANIGQAAIYTPTFTDSKGKPLNGSNNYTISINPGQTTPPLDSFWSITMYNNMTYCLDNPINRYNIGRTGGLKVLVCHD